jgi:hypothetical protein
MKTQTKQTGKTDWERLKKFRDKIYPTLQSELCSALDYLEKVEPYLYKADFPPRISLMFDGRGKYKNDLGKLSKEQEKELEDNQSRISEFVSDIAERHNLEAIPGILGGRYIRKGVYKNKLIKGLGYYTFIFKYPKFAR